LSSTRRLTTTPANAGYFDADGVLFFSRGSGEMIKTAGANVNAREVEW